MIELRKTDRDLIKMLLHSQGLFDRILKYIEEQGELNIELSWCVRRDTRKNRKKIKDELVDNYIMLGQLIEGFFKNDMEFRELLEQKLDEIRKKPEIQSML